MGFRSGKTVRERAANWWERRAVACGFVLLAAVPLLWPDLPPLIDLPGHLARYKVQLDLASSPALQQFYTFQWTLVGNLGVDLLIIPLTGILPLEQAAKAIILLIPPLTVIGFLWLAREAHGRIPPTALFALPFAYNFPFHFGFVNFVLAMALGFLAFALWLHLGRRGRLALRALLFVPISLLLWLSHALGWGAVGTMLFGAEFARRRGGGEGMIARAFRAGLTVLPLAPPALLMPLWRSGQRSGQTHGWFDLDSKLLHLVVPLRDRWWWLDLPALALVAALIVLAWRSRRLGFSPALLGAALALLPVFLLLPRVVFGSSYGDMRLVPYMLALAVLAIRTDALEARLARRLALVGAAFLCARTAGTTASLYFYDQVYDRESAALDHVPRGARLLSFVGTACRTRWRTTRLEHLPGLAVVRREAFSNDQWFIPGALLLGMRYPQGGYFTRDPSQIVLIDDCRNNGRWRPLPESLRRFPRHAFDYVWLINPPAFDPAAAAGLQPIWRSGRSVLYRVADRIQPPLAAKDPP